MSPIRWIVSVVTLASIWLFDAAGAWGEFDLPVLNTVPKVVSFNEDVPLAQLERYLDVRDLTLELRTRRGNLLPEPLLTLLKNRFSGTPKRIVLTGPLRAGIVDQLRMLGGIEVLFEVPAGGLDPETVNNLYGIGPVRKTIVLPEGFGEEAVRSVRKLKFAAPAVRLEPGSFFSSEQLGWLLRERSRRKLFFLPADTDPARVYELCAVFPLALEVRTTKNRVAVPLLEVLEDLKDVEITLVVDGRITIDDARQWTRLERFSLKVEIDDPNQVTPGLGQLLNRIAPP